MDQDNQRPRLPELECPVCSWLSWQSKRQTAWWTKVNATTGTTFFRSRCGDQSAVPQLRGESHLRLGAGRGDWHQHLHNLSGQTTSRPCRDIAARNVPNCVPRWGNKDQEAGQLEFQISHLWWLLHQWSPVQNMRFVRLFPNRRWCPKWRVVNWYIPMTTGQCVYFW